MEPPSGIGGKNIESHHSPDDRGHPQEKIGEQAGDPREPRMALIPQVETRPDVDL